MSQPPKWISSSGRWIDPKRMSPRRPDERGLDEDGGDEFFRVRDVVAGSLWSIREVLRMMVERRASDLYLCSGQAPRFRVDGEVVASGDPPPDEEHMVQLLFSLLDERDRRVFEETGDHDFSIQEPGLGRFRVNLYKHRAGIGAVFRPIPNKVPKLDSLELPPILQELAHAERGLVLMTGATGSGKSTTLAALVTAIAETRSVHITTVEDPIEFTIPQGRSLVSQRQVGVHAPSFAQALRDALREDIDVLMVGEMRDLETVSLALEAAETGLLVLGTLHTPSAARAITRIIDIFPSSRQDQVKLMLADSLRAVVAQQLVPRVDTKGRVPAVEVLMSTPALSFSIREGRTQNIYTTIVTGRELGMITMEQSLQDLVRRKIITQDAANERAHKPEGMARAT